MRLSGDIEGKPFAGLRAKCQQPKFHRRSANPRSTSSQHKQIRNISALRRARCVHTLSELLQRLDIHGIWLLRKSKTSQQKSGKRKDCGFQFSLLVRA
jgi:hypothetical protein